MNQETQKTYLEKDTFKKVTYLEKHTLNVLYGMLFKKAYNPTPRIYSCSNCCTWFVLYSLI